MQLEPYSTLNWAYQLHFYLCSQTHYRRKHELDFLADTFLEICQRHDYHPLKFKFYPDHARCLVSARPSQSISDVMQKIKGGMSKVACSNLSLTPPFWASGYFARSVGKVSARAVKEYLGTQSEHHGYAHRARPPVFRYRAKSPKSLKSSHAVFDLNYHLVLSTRWRRGVFDSSSGQALSEYWLRVADKYGFAIDQISTLPDHVHMFIRIVPKVSIEECALKLMNNGQHFFSKHFPSALIEAGIDRLWQPTAYGGTCGNVTTALVKSFLSQEF